MNKYKVLLEIENSPGGGGIVHLRLAIIFKDGTYLRLTLIQGTTVFEISIERVHCDQHDSKSGHNIIA